MKPTGESEDHTTSKNNNKSPGSESDNEQCTDRSDTPPLGKLSPSRKALPIILPRTLAMPSSPTPQLNDEGLVVPRKLINPNMDSKEKQDLHRELMFNQKAGKSVLNQKTELEKVMEKRNDNKKKKEAEKERVDRRNSFERKLEERLRVSESDDTVKKNSTNNGKGTNHSPTPAGEQEIPEFLRIHAKLHANDNKKNANNQLLLDNAQRT